MTTLTPERIEDFARELRKWWSFDDYQQHTHSWHSREDFIEKKLPDLLSAYDAISRDGMREALVRMRDRDDKNGSLPAWYRAEIDAALSPDAPRQKVED